MAPNSNNLIDYRDANQKRRRYRGGRVRRLARKWAHQNPVTACVATAALTMCVVFMSLEFLGSGSSGNHKNAMGRMQRARLLLDHARGTTTRSGPAGERDGLDDDARRRRRQRRHRAGNDSAEEEEGNDKKSWNLFGGNKKKPERFTARQRDAMLEELDHDITTNRDGGIRWTAPYLIMPPIETNLEEPSEDDGADGVPVVPAQLKTRAKRTLVEHLDEEMTRGKTKRGAVDPRGVNVRNEFFRVQRKNTKMDWEAEYEELEEKQRQHPDQSVFQPPLDYASHEYDYPELLWEVPDTSRHNCPYPPLKPLAQLMRDWPQDQDYPRPDEPIPETLLHFNYSDPKELEMARKFRDAELPFKLYDVPEVAAATLQWTDDYVSANFNNKDKRRVRGGLGKLADGTAQESHNNFFAFFQPNLWDVPTMGLPPVRNNDWSFAQWSKHARYADAVALNASKPHFYWQSGVPREERMMAESEWTFISRDLPSFSSPKKTFFVFNPQSQKGIQCRFGERGVVAATHYDSGRNMIAMVTGSKRYVLSPPNQCPKLGIVPWKHNAEYRHSLLNFGHINYLDQMDRGELPKHGGNDDGEDLAQTNQLSDIERHWMEVAGTSRALETVLKAGEVLYIPSHWFHYIISLQKSAQCNVRSGVDNDGNLAFGNRQTVKMCGQEVNDD